MVVPIDMKSGKLGTAIDGSSSREEFTVHPEHGSQIEGICVPHWQEAMDLAKQCLQAFPRLKFAGLDIAFSNEGPCILEMNASPAREGAAIVDLPTGRILVD